MCHNIPVINAPILSGPMMAPQAHLTPWTTIGASGHRYGLRGRVHGQFLLHGTVCFGSFLPGTTAYSFDIPNATSSLIGGVLRMLVWCSLLLADINAVATTKCRAAAAAECVREKTHEANTRQR